MLDNRIIPLHIYETSYLLPYEEAFQHSAFRFLRRERDSPVIHRLSRCGIYIIGLLFLLCGDLLNLPNLPNSQEPHAHCCRYVHEACEDLGVEVNISTFLP